jgi:ADP-ribose pyrophosphatase YjhB (NUDIX family)
VDLLAGSWNRGRPIQEGITREVQEETGLEIKLDAPLLPFERIVKSGGQTTLHVIYIDYMGRLLGGQFHPASDVGEGIWIHPGDLPRIWDELHEDTRRLLKIAKVV